MLESLLIGVVSGIVSSLIIYFLVFKIKPNVKISTQIAKSYDENNNAVYRVKIVNASKFAIYNLRYSLEYCNEGSDGIIFLESIPSRKGVLNYISKNKKEDTTDKHAVRISYDFNEQKFALDDSSYLRFTFIATHGFTNTTQYIEKNFYKKDIIEGSFETGNSLKILVNKK